MAQVSSDPSVVANYELHARIAAGGMASVHLGRMLGTSTARRLVAIKRLHDFLAADPAYAEVLLQEARITQQISHPNVVATLDVVAHGSELLLVMEYVPGETVARLVRSASKRGERCAVDVAASVVRDTLRGLAAAHATRDADGRLLGIVHRDVSPQNILVGSDGIAKVLDFGIAKVVGSQLHTRTGEVKGKIPYMAPEVLDLEPATPQADVWGAAVVLWEMLCGRRLFEGDSDVAVWTRVLRGPIPSPAEVLGAPTPLDHVVLRGLSRDRHERYASAEEMAQDIEAALRPAAPEVVAAWVDGLAGQHLAERDRMVQHFEKTAVMAPAVSAGRASARGALADGAVASNPSQRRAPRAVWIVAAGLLFASGTAALLAVRSPAVSASGQATSATTSPALEPPTLVSAATQAPAETAPQEAPRPSASPRPRATAPPPPKATAPKATAHARGSKSCEPPYTIDADGHKIFKLECVK